MHRFNPTVAALTVNPHHYRLVQNEPSGAVHGTERILPVYVLN